MKQCFRLKILLDNASAVNPGVIIHENGMRTHGSKKWMNILAKDVTSLVHYSHNTTREDVEISAEPPL